MKLPASPFLLACCLSAAGTGAAEWRTQPQASRLEFAGTSQGSEFKGRFKRFTPHVRFDPTNPAAGAFDVAIELASATTGNTERDEALPTQDFFWVGKFPRARFVANACKALQSPGKFSCQATLTLRGKTRKLVFPVAWSGDKGKARLTSRVELDRLDFGVGAGDWADAATIGHTVTVTVDLDLRATTVAPKP